MSLHHPNNKECGVRRINCRPAAIFLIVAVMIVLSVPWVNAGHTASNMGIIEEGKWRYFWGTRKPPLKWNQEEFDDSRWIKAPHGTGYGNSHPALILDDMKGRYSRVYSRRLFNVDNPQAVVKMGLSVVCDGPFAAYLNGMPAIRNIMGLSVKEHAGGSPIGEELDISGWAHELNTGLNVLAIQCDNDDINSTDFLFIPFLKIIEGRNAK